MWKHLPPDHPNKPHWGWNSTVFTCFQPHKCANYLSVCSDASHYHRKTGSMYEDINATRTAHEMCVTLKEAQYSLTITLWLFSKTYEWLELPMMLWKELPVKECNLKYHPQQLILFLRYSMTDTVIHVLPNYDTQFSLSKWHNWTFLRENSTIYSRKKQVPPI